MKPKLRKLPSELTAKPQDTENQLRVLCKKELISDNDQFITVHADAGVLTNRIL